MSQQVQSSINLSESSIAKNWIWPKRVASAPPSAELQPHVRLEREDEASVDTADDALVELLSFLDDEIQAEAPAAKKTKATNASLFE